MKFTGERYMPAEQGQIRIEHYHRYAMVLNLVQDKAVLDIACGEGYGSYLISDNAQSVVGVDISDEAVRHASTLYSKANLKFVQGSAISLSLPDCSFDVVVSFETIEHLVEQEEMLLEIRRVLRPNGILIISSPNRPVYSEESSDRNEFHLKELDFQEFNALLRARFPKVEYFGQRMLMSSVIQPLNESTSTSSVWSDDGNKLHSNSSGLIDPVYYLAVCGAATADLPRLRMSALYPQSIDLIKHYVGFAKWAKSLEVVVTERDGQITNLNQLIYQREGSIEDLAQTVRERDDQVTDLSQAVTERDGQIASLSQVVTERDEQISELSQEVDDRGGEIERLSYTLKERDGQITSLSQVVTERDEQISELSQEVDDRGGEIERLSYTLKERDGQITSLSHAVTERDGQITDLSQVVDDRGGEIERLRYTLKERDGQITSLSQAVTDRDSQIASLSELVSERDGQITSLTDETVRRGQWALGLDAELKDERANLHKIIRSNSWQITRPLRETRRWLSSPISQTKRYARESARLAKSIYQSLPFSAQTRIVHRNLILRYAPKLLLASGSPAQTLPILAVPEPLHDLTRVANAEQLRVAVPSLPTSEQPIVSVIIPVYGKVEYTLRCLASIAKHEPQIPFEIIVVDDCSPDDTVAVLAEISGLRLLQNETNQGFIRTCNAGAKIALGSYLHFLNNDTEVTAGCLDELLRTFDSFPGTGLAGSKLVYPDGRLQEAGGIIWRDGSAWNFGRFQDPLLPIYNYAREVDYCSGASIMVPKALFDELGAFDEHYTPAYCEDSDLALKIRHKGCRVIYQPLSTVIHYEGITSGTDETQGVKSYQVENSKKLFHRWQNLLATHQAAGVDVDAAKDRRAQRRVLVLDHCTPTPNQDAGSVTAFNLMLLLREMDFQVTFIPEDNFLYMPEYTTGLQRAGIEVLYAPYETSVEQHLKECGERYDLAFLFRPGVIDRHLEVVRKYCPQAKVLFETADLHHLRMHREAELMSDTTKLKAAEEMKIRELAAMKAVDATIIRSSAELELLRPLIADANLHVFPLIMDAHGSDKSYQDRRDIVFVGGYQHTPNVDAVKYFVEEVMPLLRKKLPGVRFYAVGSKPPDEIKALASEDIIITGFVEDLALLLEKIRVSVAPLRYGAGIKGKIGTAMAVGLPVVATSLAAEGMSLTDGENILVADGAEALSNSIARIYKEEALWNRISKNGLAFAEKAWGAEAAWEILSTILADIGIKVNRARYSLSLFTERPPECFVREI